MAVLKCKMCGGDLHFEEGASTCECEYCGNTNTLPVVGSDQEMNLFNRANHFRMINEFDRAIIAYEKLLDADDTNAEAHWGVVLSRYGIEYVEDPVSHERIPTCHRVQLTSILSDPDYLAAVEHADFIAAAEYKAQAERIAQIQKGILAISSQEKPYDVFICYKETDDNGRRTVDSTLAQDIYYGLNESGYRVFFSRITLEDKLGQEYEPYIFAALHSSKVMLVVGTKPEYFNAVWVKNEWSRYLALMKDDRHRLLIPCYRDMDPYDLPDELSMLQSQDMGRIGFMQDLLRGIRKVLAKETVKSAVPEKVVVQQTASGTTANAQVKRGNMALEDHDWDKADAFFEEALNLDPEYAEAYIGKLLAKDKKPDFVSWVEMQKEKYSTATSRRLEACPADTLYISAKANEYGLEGYLDKKSICNLYDFDRGYKSVLSCRESQKTKQKSELASESLLNRAQKYAKGAMRKQIEDGLAEIYAVLDQRITEAEEEDNASISRVKAEYEAHIANADRRAEAMNIDAQNRREKRYQSAVSSMKAASDMQTYDRARDALKAMNGYKDSNDLAAKCQKEIERLIEEKRKEEERQAAIRKKEAERAAKKRRIAATAVVVFIIAALVVTKIIIPIVQYEKKHDYASAASGDEIYFGSYEQDNNIRNGKEEIEWIVLEKREDQLLVVSKYALDSQPYNSSGSDTTWESCSLRSWLNGTFVSEAFSDEETNQILTSTVTADSNPEYNTSAGNDTQDQVFLFSATEAEKYFSTDSERQCKPTAYTIAHSWRPRSTEGNCWWWLRSPGYGSTNASDVRSDGSINANGGSVDKGDAVRPAMWINLEP